MIAIRILRVLRSVKIFRYFKAMRSLILAISFNLAQLSNILLLQFIVMFVFAVIGHHAFGTINESATLNMGGHVSFSTFPSSLLLVYILNTGENWPGIMNDCMLAPGDDPQSPLCSYEDGTCGVQWAPVYFLMMQVIVNWVLVNSFVAITMSAFEEFLGSFEEIKDVEQLVDELAKVWSRFDPEGRGAMPFAQIVPFYQQLQIALREVKWMHDTDKPTAQELFRELRVEKNMVKYLPVLSCLVLYWSGHSLPSHNRALRRHLRHLRQITKTSPVDGPDTTTFPIAWSILTAQRHWRGQRERRALIGKTTSTADITDGTQSKASPPATDKMADWVMIAMDKKDTLTPSHT
ncbi:hypothetical protein M427DRAFT_225771 [Gonapodya prolifera JEL478]|uniref:Ion transport domain-containing protein n=1 Tax=Gonapodya prolifera (strain JEL478) TaxID=1344416 RepID=A0A139AP46_GONPJ|nr:hypothetical protein M427DRAFT_225771 [Gonapodya prolifera JEL478]|eukprot:KXS18265.1 hypothetical protein M427DRAFT_225771 [Gonapodya prolifera JEL478]